MSDHPNLPVDPATERRLAAAFHALATSEVPSAAPRPERAPRPADPSRAGRRRRFQVAGGGLLAVAAAVVIALVIGTEVNEARTDPTVAPGTGVASTPAPSSVTTPPPTASSAPPSPGGIVPGTSTGPVVPSSPTATDAGTGGPGLCTPTVMTFAVTDLDPAAGSAYFEVHAVNASTSPCVTTGFPGLALLDASGHQIVQADRDSSVAATTIVVAPGAEVTARVRTSDVPHGTATACPTSPSFLLTLPDNTDPTVIRHTSPACGAEVRVFVPGAG